MSWHSWPAPAKLNLFLHITGRRANGYHELQTLFQFLDYCDTLHFFITGDGLIRRLTRLPGIPPEHDLIVRAAQALQTIGKTALGVDIKIDKRIPAGGGLGGGSSNAATTLVALNHLWGLNLSKSKLCEIGLALGADVPIFVHGRAAWAEGVGERFEDCNPAERYYLVVHPGCAIPTAEVFSHPDLTRDSLAITMRDFIAGRGRNDCETLVRRLYPRVQRIFEWFGEDSAARLTGTGGCVFRPYQYLQEAQQALAGLPDEFSGFVAQGNNRSKLVERLASASNGS